MVPAKHIVSLAHVEMFKTSQACAELVGFIDALAQAVKSSKMTECQISDVIISPIHKFVASETY